MKWSGPRREFFSLCDRSSDPKVRQNVIDSDIDLWCVHIRNNNRCSLDDKYCCNGCFRLKVRTIDGCNLPIIFVPPEFRGGNIHEVR